MKYLLSILLALTWATFTAAVCCDTDGIGRCDDGTLGTPCCGNGECNVFCCNCDGGCRTTRKSDVFGGHGRRPTWEHAQKSLTPADDSCAYTGAIEMMDRDGSGDLSLGEYLAWVAGTRAPQVLTNATLTDIWIQYFASFDANGDGKLQPQEIHKRYDFASKN
ncbi:hypothetical protein TWF281_004594 [Arthrobotrys megalospora]